MKFRLFLLAVVCMLTFSGCGSTTEIDKRSIVHAVGIDKSDEGFEVSLQIFAPSGTGSDTPVDVSMSNAKVVSAVGETIYDGMKNCEKLLGSEAFMGHNKFVIFGQSLYGEDMNELLGWFRMENENYLGVTIGYCVGSAKDILDIQMKEGVSAVENMELVHDYAVKNGTSAKGDLLMLFNDLALTTKSGFLPVFSVKDKEQSGEGSEAGGESKQKEQYLEINSSAVIRDGKIAGFLNSDEVAGVLWLTGEMEKNRVSVELGGKIIDIELENKLVFPKVFEKNGKLVASYSINAEARVVEELTSEQKRQICRLSQEKILSDCQKAIKKTVDDYATDILRIEQLVKFYKPSVFRQNSKDFYKVIEQMEFRADVRCKLAN